MYKQAEEELEKLKQYYALLSPDFSMFTNMPIALQIESVFKNRWCGAYWQSKGLKVIPTVSWGDERSFEFCSWEQGGSSLELKYKVGYPNLIPLSKAKKLYKFNKLFNPDFEDFINNLLFYGEMEFKYKNFKYVVDRYTDKFEIQICKVNDYENRQSYKSIDEFISKAKIDNKLLKDIWEDITNVNWQS